MDKASTRGEFARICNALPRLTAKELEQVRLRLTDPRYFGLLTGTTDSNGSASKGPPVHARTVAADDDWLLRGIEYELRRRGVLRRGLPTVAARRIVSGWDKRSKAARTELVHALGGTPTPSDLSALGRLAASALADYLRSWAEPPQLEAQSMCANVGKVLVALDAQFPGYAAAGLLECCLDPRLVGAD